MDTSKGGKLRKSATITSRRRLISVLFRSLILLVLGWASGPALPAAGADQVVGDWLVASRDAVIRVTRVGDEYQGSIVWLLHANFTAEDGPQLAGHPVTDRYNPDPALRERPILGMRLLWGLHFDGKDTWQDGRVYDSDDGHTYHCHVHMEDPDHLRLRGYVGFSLLGGSTVWTRTSGPYGQNWQLPPPDPSARPGANGH